MIVIVLLSRVSSLGPKLYYTSGYNIIVLLINYYFHIYNLHTRSDRLLTSSLKEQNFAFGETNLKTKLIFKISRFLCKIT